MSERWRPIMDWPNYEVSDLGRVRSIPRERTRGGILKQVANGNGYWSVTLCRGPETKRIRVHKLVTEAFLGPCPAGEEVRHRDDNRNDNRLVNLLYGTRSENKLDMRRTGGFVQSEKKVRALRGPRTHCRLGEHELTEANVYVGPDGKRRCRPCGDARFKRRDDRRRAERGRVAA